MFWAVLLSAGMTNREARGQSTSGTYLVYTFEDTYKISPHGTESYYWLQPLDSVQAGPAGLRVFFPFGFEASTLFDCRQGTAFNPFSVPVTDMQHKFDKQYFAAADTLERVVYRGRKKIQTITKRWGSGQRETIEVYVTPVAGRFCYAPFSQAGFRGSSYRGLVFLPLSHFKPYPAFWSDPRHAHVLNQDYSQVPFSALPRLYELKPGK